LPETPLGTIDGGVSIAGRAIRGIIDSNGFEIQTDKTHLMRRTQRQRVTGLVVNEKVNVSRDYVRGLRNLLYIWDRYGESAAEESFWRTNPYLNWPPEKPKPAFRDVVRGRVQHVGSVKGWTDAVYLSLASSLSILDEPFTVPEPAATPQEARLLAEGQSDVDHMLAAQGYFHGRGEFTQVQLIADENSDSGGDTELLKSCRALARVRQHVPCVCLFDRDSEEMVRKATNGGDWKSWGNGVVAVALVGPPDEKVCIEMLHDNDVLTTFDPEGRRVFLLSEFNTRTGQHQGGLYTTLHAKSKSLVLEEVHELGGERNVALSKRNFSEAVRSKREPFAELSFEGFRSTFQAIAEAVRAASLETPNR